VTHDLAESFGMDHPRGALVAKVLPDSPARAAGLKAGDVIVNFDGKDIRNSSSLPPIVGSTRVGVDIPVDVIRNSKTMPLKVKLGELPDDLTKVSAAKPLTEQTNRLGLGVADLTEEQKLELETEHGVLVQRLASGAAARSGVQKGDARAVVNGVAKGVGSAVGGVGQGVGSAVGGAADGVLSVGKGLFSGVKNVGKGIGGAFGGGGKRADRHGRK